MTYRRIRSLTRGIDVLRYLNTVQGAQPTDICKELKLPRPTVHRILDTLEEMKLVHRGYYSREFRLTDGVKRLARAKGVYEDLRQAAWPIMHELTARHVWPCDLAVFHDNAMLIVESTHRSSPLSSDIGMVGMSRSMTKSPLGRAFLSHCCDVQREAIFAALALKAGENDELLRHREAIDRMIEQGRNDGFSMCPELPHTRCASIAAPIRVRGNVVATMNMVWNVKELTFADAGKQLGVPLLAARDQIERRLTQIDSQTQGHVPQTQAPVFEGVLLSDPGAEPMIGSSAPHQA